MKREILFRGLRIDSKGWVYGYYVLTSKKYHQILPGNWSAKTGSHNAHNVKPETVGQFTGLLDKNGVKIFEGDVVSFRIEEVPELGILKMAVVFINGVFGVALNTAELNLNDLKNLVVTSNIHQP